MTRFPHIFAWLDDVASDLRAVRQDIHAHPELGFEENRTAALVARSLEEWGYQVHSGIGKTGVVGVLRNGSSPRRLGLRADMDALPIVENSGVAYSSRHSGCMHACGHDGHTAMLLGAARYLAATRQFDGTLTLIFQPAEEGQGGAEAMLADGLLERFPCDALFGMHNMPGLPAGHLGFREGPMMASQDLLTVTLEGVGGHGSMPHLTVDPLVAAASVVMALQTVVARNIDAQEAAVVTVGALQAGEAANVIPQQALLRLSLRALNAPVREQMLERVKAIIHTQAQSFGCSASIEHRPAYPVLVNSPEQTEFARQVGVALLGEQAVDGNTRKLMGSEDFAWMLQRCPGSYLFIGNGLSRPMVHNPGYDFNDDILLTGAAYWAALAESWLEPA
ncbi:MULTISPECIES: M20 aminoacylase family protein [Pseudomonas]|uniref:Amidohydrolase n=1 Tax=Pseudomonas chlororaphis O6 TaxID=1037915 RepID=A0AB33WMJ9_9PSED|nr:MULTISPECIES: M20 aminoacylase family protein [Pseudomonas]AIC18488.1 amidohydrolase [Pseudomonas chlororaphis]AZE21827.1 N-acyl-L-amino acid amidohydrolase [Pseudomonas chlororaphis subsp. aureofaciens]AZE34430.1 N-acyl-L-amino acid amidohydrolase [Pseudomonas chlororaphis subsp. aureofaciens]AZE40762.1 N-acyl-L-amino acid amidohydrolase [Pseudomonas chlororaphis subsp. aureofaciens]EIM14232.1 amidohydrolase [Pseudomonas chlororaphis O6]